MIPILILAAGTSSRMRGRDKLLEIVQGKPLLRLQVQRAQATGHPVYVALASAEHPRNAVITGTGATPLFVPEAAEGMSGTMREAVTALPQAAAFMMILGDLVALETSDLTAVLDARTTHPDHLIWRGATTDGSPGHPIIFDQSLRPKFTTLSGDGGGETLVRPLKSRTYLVPFADDRARLDLDTPDDWATWRRSVGQDQP